MKKTIVVKGKSAPKKTVRKPFRKNDANKLSVCSIKGTCPIADVYNCQFTYGGYDPLTMSAIGLYTGQYIWGAKQHLRPNPVRRWKPALLLRSAHCSNVRRHRSLQVLESQWLKD